MQQYGCLGVAESLRDSGHIFVSSKLKQLRGNSSVRFNVSERRCYNALLQLAATHLRIQFATLIQPKTIPCAEEHFQRRMASFDSIQG
jgi:hypothetical protein